MTQAHREALAALLADISEGVDAQGLASRWGTVRPDSLNPGRLESQPGPESPFRMLHLTPWTADGYGLVDVDLRESNPWAWDDLREAFGPFEAGPPLETGDTRFMAPWAPDPAAPHALVQAWLKGQQVVALTIRRDPPSRSRTTGAPDQPRSPAGG
jgi:hypothetical protein